jgi:hypothetical protein
MASIGELVNDIGESELEHRTFEANQNHTQTSGAIGVAQYWFSGVEFGITN